MAGISICNDGSKIVNIGQLGALSLWYAQALLALFSVMEKLSGKEMADFVGYSGLERWILAKTDSCVCVSVGNCVSHKGNLPDQGQARPMQKQLKMIANRRRRLCRDTWPSE